MKMFRAFVWRNRLTFWLTHAVSILLAVAGLRLLMHQRGDWFFTVGLAVLTPVFILLLRGRDWK